MNIRLASVFCFAVLAGLFLLGAQSVPGATVQATDNPEFGILLSTGGGQSLYLFVRDTGAGSSCYDRCAVSWPPLLVEGVPVAGEGVESELLGTIEREDGTMQVTYAGRPLYTYFRDEAKGDTKGHGVGDAFFLVTPEGERAHRIEVEEAAVEVSEEELAEMMAEGERLFASICAACHGSQGEGRVGPGLDGYLALERSDLVINTILNGRIEHGMPPFRDQFNDFQVASVATFVRNSWSNQFGPVVPEEVSEMR